MLHIQGDRATCFKAAVVGLQNVADHFVRTKVTSRLPRRSTIQRGKLALAPCSLLGLAEFGISWPFQPDPQPRHCKEATNVNSNQDRSQIEPESLSLVCNVWIIGLDKNDNQETAKRHRTLASGKKKRIWDEGKQATCPNNNLEIASQYCPNQL